MGEPPFPNTPLEDPVPARPVLLYALPSRAPDPMRLDQVTRGRAAVDLVLALAVGLVVPFALDAALALWNPEQSLASFVQGLAARKWGEALLVGGLAAALLVHHRLAPASFGLQARRLDRQVLWAIPTLAIVYFGFALSMVIVMIWVTLQPGWEQDLQNRTEFIQLLPTDSLLGTIALMLPVALHEELLFRGLLIPYLRRITGHWFWAVLISTSIFAVLHIAQGMLGIVQVFAVGLALAICFVATRSLLAAVLAHFAFNVLQVQLARLVLPYVEQLKDSASP